MERQGYKDQAFGLTNNNGELRKDGKSALQ